MKLRAQGFVYFLGLIPLGLFYEPIKKALGGQWHFLAGGVAYLLVLRLLAELIGRLLERRKRNDQT